MDQHYHPLIYQRLRSLFVVRDWDALEVYLSGLSHAHFRTAGYMIGERLMADVEEDVFWEVMTRLVLWHPKAFTVTLAKSAERRFAEGSLSLSDDGFVLFAQTLQGEVHTIDRQKLLMQWLPSVHEPQTMEMLFDVLGVVNPVRRVDFLLRTPGIVAAFVLLRSLRFEEHDREWLVTVCRHLMRRGDSLSYNVASLLRSYFDLQEVRGVFSLQLQPYELSRVDTDFEVFCRVVKKV